MPENLLRMLDGATVRTLFTSQALTDISPHSCLKAKCAGMPFGCSQHVLEHVHHTPEILTCLRLAQLSMPKHARFQANYHASLRIVYWAKPTCMHKGGRVRGHSASDSEVEMRQNIPP